MRTPTTRPRWRLRARALAAAILHTIDQELKISTVHVQRGQCCQNGCTNEAVVMAFWTDGCEHSSLTGRLCVPCRDNLLRAAAHSGDARIGYCPLCGKMPRFHMLGPLMPGSVP